MYSLLHTFIHDSYGHNEATAVSREPWMLL